MFSRIQSVHFVGICGTAMAATAAAMQEKGVQVTGSDQNVYPPMSTFLAERKIEVISGYAEQNLAHKPDLVIIDRKSTRLNSSHLGISYAVFCLKKKTEDNLEH